MARSSRSRPTRLAGWPAKCGRRVPRPSPAPRCPPTPPPSPRRPRPAPLPARPLRRPLPRAPSVAEMGGRPVALPMLAVHTVGAGGGSIAWRDPGGALRVGPQSAGADPGPACYGRGGTEPTVTDANLLLGRLGADSPLAGGVKLDREAAAGAIREPAR